MVLPARDHWRIQEFFSYDSRWEDPTNVLLATRSQINVRPQPRESQRFCNYYRRAGLVKNLTYTPRVTFILLGYNQEKYVRDAIAGALSQEYPDLQIILSDDGSVDATFALMKAAVDDYSGHHEVILNRNLTNLGIGSHVNRLMEIATGDIVIAAAADDISLPNRTRRTVEAFVSAKERVYSVWSRALYIDGSGNPVSRRFPGNRKGFSDRSIVRNQLPVIGATHAWRKEVFEFFGPLSKGVMFEDNAISFRSYLLGSISYADEVLVKYRTHSENITNFSQNKDLKSLYAAAARRSNWAMAGLEQRIHDLHLAAQKIERVKRSYQIMLRELNRQRIMINRRRVVYANFPEFDWTQLSSAFSDREIAKVLARSIWSRIR